MEEIEKLLKNPFNEVKENDLKGFQDKCLEITNELFKYFCIQCGDRCFRFAEIEFYYYDYYDFNKEWNEKTYARTKKSAGDLFFHYSGVDICFDSDFDNKTFGGILIRSLVEKLESGAERYITGPLFCVNEILNSCAKKKEWPKIIKTEERICDIEQCPRFGISYEDKDFQDNICFYDKSIVLKNEFPMSLWNYQKGEPKNVKRYYKRFE